MEQVELVQKIRAGFMKDLAHLHLQLYLPKWLVGKVVAGDDTADFLAEDAVPSRSGCWMIAQDIAA